MVMEKNKCYNDDLLACQKKLVILELCAARVCVWGYVHEHTCVGTQAALHFNTVTKSLLHGRKHNSQGWQPCFAEG